MGKILNKLQVLFAEFWRPYNIIYSVLHALVGITVVYVTTRSLATVSIYVLLDASLHGIFVHQLAHRTSQAVSTRREHSNNLATTLEAAFFFVFHVFAAFTLAMVVTGGDIGQAKTIGAAEPAAQGVVKFIYTVAWKRFSPRTAQVA